ncbi:MULTISPECIES: DEAD/DEAH box helicase [Sphingomonadales]|uniref:ATP-dependent helicase n=2 Tax=Edaphosphingomonas TaxID=3423724 RepID=A0A2T4I616_9SPHN|nr:MULTISPECIES: DEAD/DEAH box helicase [Sphingomonas]AGH48433.1 putative helicase [Sphingomonas sp. MM-1]MDX3883387.1 DEAD/DEAH box helicase [Sphingomonas sp.]OHT20908.1 ATP-dependent RNA helicase DeaD [Sphingomonas haloaromaticamans]PTD26086.1 ATP-dependent helicase [Sphingomonas fennica]
MPFSRLPALLGEALTERGYAAPTPVQAAVLEEGADHRDLIVSAQTGSGKTVAFGLAIAAQLLDDQGRMGPAGAPIALAIAPTRELALQVSRELMWLYGKAGARIVSCVGGMDPSRERRNLSHGAHIVVGTPGRLRDHLERGALDLSGLGVVVLDEADEMLDMGFREDLEEILDATPEGRRTLLFSATMPKPIVMLAKRYQKDALRISTMTEDRGHGDITYQAVTVAPSDIEAAVVNLLRLHEPDTAILFCATRDAVRHLHANLVERGFQAVALSGEHSQSERNHALQALRDRRARVCVATDVAARGIDLPSLSLVVHVELPRDHEALQHRSGRTGRAGKKGTAVLIVPYQRRRRVESMLRGARIQAEWVPVPTADDIRAADRERLLATLSAPVEIDEEDRALGQRLMAELSAEDIAAMLVRSHRAKLPAPEDLVDQGPKPRERPEGPRPGFEDTVWFHMNVGRRHNADPRWLLPLLCRRGHITKQDVGAIRIAADETMFEIPRHVAARFASALKRTAGADPEGDGGILIEPMHGNPRETQRQNRRSGPPPGRHQARPTPRPGGPRRGR